MSTGMGWKVTMLILSSLALVLGTVILILNVYSNRWVSIRPSYGTLFYGIIWDHHLTTVTI